MKSLIVSAAFVLMVVGLWSGSRASAGQSSPATPDDEQERVCNDLQCDAFCAQHHGPQWCGICNPGCQCFIC